MLPIHSEGEGRGGGGDREFLLRVSYMEIYNEQIFDLLAPPPPEGRGNGPASPARQSSIRIFESKAEGVVIRGLKEEIVTSPEQVFALLAAGEARRRTGSTNMNKQSSRSHSIFRLIVESTGRRRGAEDSGDKDSASASTSGPVRVSTLSLVDLAGSESVKATGATGSRQKEGQYINKSLMTLGHVVYKLSDISMRASSSTSTAKDHIPYRDSKLTRLLQPSLSGNAQICIICNVSPLVRNLDESHNTLKFATRAKKIKQTATVTEVMDDRTLLQNYREEIEQLKHQLREAKKAHEMAGSRGAEDEKKEDVMLLPPPLPGAAGGDTPSLPEGTAIGSGRGPSDGGASAEEEEKAKREAVAAAVAADEDARALVGAIRDLEKLILKKSSFSSDRGKSGGSSRHREKKGRVTPMRSNGGRRSSDRRGGGRGGGKPQYLHSPLQGRWWTCWIGRWTFWTTTMTVRRPWT